jgi:hypothetical protein
LISWRVFRRSWSFGVCRFLVGSSSFLEMNGFWRIRSLLELECGSCWCPGCDSFPSFLLITATSWVSTWLLLRTVAQWLWLGGDSSTCSALLVFGGLATGGGFLLL